VRPGTVNYAAAVLVVGLMSGTSADAVDAALVEWPDGRDAQPFRLLAAREDRLPPELQSRIHVLAAGRVDAGRALAELASLDVELGEIFADSAIAVIEAAGIEVAQVDAIASHGQTVAHHPELRATLQIGDPSVIAERTGMTTVADFRTRDVAAGGEGAPLAPFFHHAAMGSASESRLILNLGGIANVSWLPAGASPEDVIAFDVGPANALLDGVVQTRSGGEVRFDRDGAQAGSGDPDSALLESLLDDDFLRRAPPKSTGRERYGLAEAEALSRQWTGADADLLATLVAFTAESVARACREFLGAVPDRILAGGGGVRNETLIAALSERVGCRVEPMDAVGVPADAAEAMAFSLMGRNALLGIPNHLPRTTGARAERVLGEIVPGASGAIRPRA
jgi:anhydro-N-acetylmuramic acid kinase